MNLPEELSDAHYVSICQTYIGTTVKKTSGNKFPGEKLTGIVKGVVKKKPDPAGRVYFLTFEDNTSEVEYTCVKIVGKEKRRKPHTDLELCKAFVLQYERAKTRGIPCTLSFSKFKALKKQKTCYYTGVTFDDTNPDLQRSIDRVDNEKGYHNNNVVACCSKINNLKADMTIEQIQNLHCKIQEFLSTNKCTKTK